MKVAIIEDETLSQEHLERLILRLPYEIEIIAKLDSVKSCFAFFEQSPLVDLIFMDIHLADGNAFDFLKDFPVSTPIVFTTAFDQYTLNAFKVNAIDYLLKPIDKNELEMAIQKHIRLTSKQQNELLENIRQLTKIESYKTRFMVKLGDSLTGIKSEEIHHLRSEDGVVLLVTDKNKRYPLDYTLDQLESMIDPSKFFRINRKVIVHIDGIERVGTFFNSRLKVHATILPEEDAIVSRERVNNFKYWFNQ
jgi:DNA-binding LytR/AlgR family response regulator